MTNLNIQEMKEMIQSSNINFFIGSGLSTPFLSILNDIEEKLVKEQDHPKKMDIYKRYFREVMLPNLAIMSKDYKLSDVEKNNYNIVHASYKSFFKVISQILLKRKSTLLSKQANIFTTNIDILMENALEECNFDYNDGFSGRFNPTYSISNFKKSISKRSLHFENISEIPVFNLAKVHGSLSWQKSESDALNQEILFSPKIEQVNKVKNEIDTDGFEEEYKKMLIVNPEKIKFEETVLNLVYYELLRMYSGELEKENAVLFVMGFSMADEHIRTITIRCANSNPTLKIYIFCYSKESGEEIKEKILTSEIKYNNIEMIVPMDDEEENKFSLDVINEKVFKLILND